MSRDCRKEKLYRRGNIYVDFQGVMDILVDIKEREQTKETAQAQDGRWAVAECVRGMENDPVRDTVETGHSILENLKCYAKQFGLLGGLEMNKH